MLMTNWMESPVIVMRPGEANEYLANVLQSQGVNAWSWPAFNIRFPQDPDKSRLESRLADLSDVEMVVLPSPASVAAIAHYVKAWPEHITVATVGEGTAKVVRAAWGEDVNLLYPGVDAEHSGSEALWELIKARGAPTRVLFLRGQTGREWLPERLRQLGSDVMLYCAYVREPVELDAEKKRQLQRAMKGVPPIVYITSSDAVAALCCALKAVPDSKAWMTSGYAVTIHPRIVEKLREAGFERICITDPDIPKVVDTVMAIRDGRR